MNHYQKTMGEWGENIVSNFYQKKGFDVVERNFTIPGGEIDIIVKNHERYIFIEVKTISQEMDLQNFLSHKKIITLKKTIEAYVRKYKIALPISLDLVFVMNGKIIELYENITNN